MVRIRHPNLFVDKCDGNIKILLVHSEKKRSACRNLFFYFFVHLRKKSPNVLRKSLSVLQKFMEIFEIWEKLRRFFVGSANFPHLNGKFVRFGIIFSEFGEKNRQNCDRKYAENPSESY
jgi:hypothetical protein